MEKSPGITISNACLQYKNQIVFDQLSFILPAAQTTCLLGPSGIGKTSLLQLIAKLNTAARADIIASDQKSLQSRIAYMPQSHALLPWLNVENNALLSFRLRGKKNSTATEKAKKLLQQFGLIPALKKYPAQLSGGMQQRVALARVLLENKPIILMDEPFSSLDTITRYQLQTLSAQALSSRTVLLITHDPLEALRLGHHIAIMSGRPAQIEYLALEFLKIPPPRSLHDPNLLQWQGKLLERLKETY